MLQKDFTHPNIPLKQTSQRLQDIKTLKQKASTQNATFPSGCCVWEAPARDAVKINWDAAIGKHKCKIEIGATVRDWEGQVLATRRVNRSLYLDPLLAESYLLFSSLSLVSSQDFS